MSKNKSKSNGKKQGKDCDAFLTKNERKELLNLVRNVDWCNESSVWSVGVELSKWSVKLRAEILRRSSDEYYE